MNIRDRLGSWLRKLFPPNTLPRKIASQLRRRIIDPRVYAQIYKESSPSESPRRREMRLEYWVWMVIGILVFLVVAYLVSQGAQFPF